MIAGWFWWAWGLFAQIPTKVKLYGGAAIVAIVVLLRWRAAGIKAAIEEIERKDRERAQRIKEKVAIARSQHPDGDNDIVERLRKYGRLRPDE